MKENTGQVSANALTFGNILKYWEKRAGESLLLDNSYNGGNEV